MTWLLPSRLTVEPLEELRRRRRPAAGRRSRSSGRGWQATRARAGPRPPAAPVSSGSLARPRASIVSRASEREARICTWLSTDALSGVWLDVATVAPARPPIGLDDQQRAGVVDRRHRRERAHAGEPGQEHAAQQQPAPAMHHLQQLGERELVVHGPGRSRRQPGRAIGSRGGHLHIIEYYLILFNLYVFQLSACGSRASRRGSAATVRTFRSPPSRVTASPPESAQRPRADHAAAAAADLRSGARDDEVDPAAILDRGLHLMGERDAHGAELDDAAGIVAGDPALAARHPASAPAAARPSPRLRSQLSRTSRSRRHSISVDRAVRIADRRHAQRPVDQQVGRAAGQHEHNRRGAGQQPEPAPALLPERQPQAAEREQGQALRPATAAPAPRRPAAPRAVRAVHSTPSQPQAMTWNAGPSRPNGISSRPSIPAGMTRKLVSGTATRLASTP